MQAPATASVEAPIGVRVLEAKDPLTHAPLPWAVFYPATGPAGGPLTVGPYSIEAARDAAIAEGKSPLVVVSHGHAGSMWGHHDLCEYLARRGYVVAAVEHVGDSYRDKSAAGTDRMLLGRPYQISAVLDAVLADGTLAPHVDATRIGVAGFSAGGYTALVLVGAKPDFDRLAGYCERHTSDPEFCGFGPVKRTLSAPRPTADPRVHAAFVMSPVGVFFGPGSFDAVQAPIFFYWATEDRVLLPAENAMPLLRELRTVRGSRAVTGAGHYVFLAPCSKELTASLPDLCTDPPGVDRSAVHAQADADAFAFFNDVLR